ncbi:single-stranded-DNA-specific exonuclease RecJ [Pseudoflavonifractor capillosus]|uniref:single-stranded-DNA-specific exonuclease RecJ n=1 Tax=Pseudoflavonifractor capillosus TaxID=106588 RepID=UPI0019570102|nr:single-stranded-DNA-specific exonuclease RecJ [Pseudoflavonifractor capillosus]MBM6694748.1 single-stranded-DNA-specific exonuclease RecJ [Pseudoflavonifractor capillosus]
MKYDRWNLRPSGPAGSRAELERAGLPPLCAAVLCARGVDTAPAASAFLAHGPNLLHDPFLLRDMEKAVERISRAIREQETLAVYGDYDVDGITATCLLTQFLRTLGGQVVSYIPDRTEEGYGLNNHAIDALARQGVTLIVTVDCGITAAQEVEYARALGVDVVITDHHQCKEVLPQAVAVVDPRRPDCSYPFPDLAGVGVALKLALALTAPAQRPQVLLDYGELAAIGTVADVMLLQGENRALVHLGLERLADCSRPGLQALLREAGCPRGQVPTTVTIGYGLAPRINAAGRMEQAGTALELLLTQDPQRGQELAQELCQLNRLRQAIELEIFQHCDQLLTHTPALSAPVIVLAGEGWHQGVIGIVASRLAEKYACPAFMISLDGDKGKGSCRSFGGFNLFGALERCAPLLDSYGGHELAAGFSIRRGNIPAFRAALCQLVEEFAGHQPMESSLDVDCEIPHCSLLSTQDVESLSLLEPFGSGNPKPVFLLRSVCVLSHTDVGGGRHLKLRLRRDGVVMDAIFFSANTAACGIENGQRLDIAFTLQINQFRGNRTVQLQLCDLRPAPTRSQLERSLFCRLQAGETLSPWEASLMLPQRRDFAHLWRYLEQLCAAGPAQAPMDQLLRQVTRSFSGHRSYGKALVCLHVMDERGLIQVAVQNQQATVRLCRPREKVDLEQAGMMRQLRHDLG